MEIYYAKYISINWGKLLTKGEKVIRISLNLIKNSSDPKHWIITEINSTVSSETLPLIFTRNSRAGSENTNSLPQLVTSSARYLPVF